MAKRKPTKKLETLSDPLKSGIGAKSRARTNSDKRLSKQESLSATARRRNDLLPALNLVMRPTVSLIDYPRRLRKRGLEDVIEAANVIADKGFIQPVIVGRDGKTILDGELRVEAARWLQLESIPCILVEHMSEIEERGVRIALNRLGARRQWNLDDLKLELNELLIEEEPINLLGFDDIELDTILADEDPVIDVTKELSEGPPISKPGDIWVMEGHRLVCGDALDPAVYGALMGDQTAQAMITDPPYNIAIGTIVSTKHAEFAQASGEMTVDEFAQFLAGFVQQALVVMDDGAIAFVFMDWRQIEILLRVLRECGTDYLNLVAWVKANAGMGSMYRSQHELVAVVKKPGPHNNRIQLGSKGRNRANVWFAPGAGTTGTDSREMLKDHPTPKPVQMLVDAIIDVTEPGNIVLDCFGGSGSTLIAADRSGRCARLIELDQHYCDVIIRRWQKHSGKPAILASTGETFEEVGISRVSSEDAGGPEELDAAPAESPAPPRGG